MFLFRIFCGLRHDDCKFCAGHVPGYISPAFFILMFFSIDL